VNCLNPLDLWCARKTGASVPLTRAGLDAYQLHRLRDTLSWAMTHSPFYRTRLAGWDPARLTRPDNLRALPFTRADDLRANDPPLLCVSQSEISRVVTLETSGTSGPPKRVYFTHEEQESTIDFFHHGMSVLTRPGDRVLILFPCTRPGGIGSLLVTALERLGATPVAAGPIGDIDKTLALMAQVQPTVVAGIPMQVRALAHFSRGTPCAARIRAVLLSADRVTRSLSRDISHSWNCEIFEHYGMTEIGLGGGVECAAHQGYHLRETDLFFEIVDPETGRVLPDGETGEIVVTTLTRRGMPLIRYRTGDLSRMLDDTCPCGSILRRLDRVNRRLGDEIPLRGGACLSMASLDQTLFAMEDITDFAVTLRRGSPDVLDVAIARHRMASQRIEPLFNRIGAALERLTAIRRAGSGLKINLFEATGPLIDQGAKRRIFIE
jgi:phenylacetate-coenzyme A ligase PaaK-like adenylate-forming protein